MPTSPSFYRLIRDVGVVGVIGWLILRFITSTQKDVLDQSARMVERVTTQMTDVIKVASETMLESINGHKDIPQPSYARHPNGQMVDDPTQGDGPVPWWMDEVSANDGGPMTRPIDPTDNDWPEPISSNPTHRTVMVEPATAANLLDQIAAMPSTPDTVTFGSDGFPAFGPSSNGGQSWSAVPRPDTSGETWEG